MTSYGKFMLTIIAGTVIGIGIYTFGGGEGKGWQAISMLSGFIAAILIVSVLPSADRRR